MEQSLHNQISAKSDVYISNVLGQSNNFSPDVVEMAKRVYEERGLGSPESQKLLADLPVIKRSVFDKIKNGDDPTQVMNYMNSKGIEPNTAKDIMRQAVAKIKNEEPEESKNKSSIIFVILAIFFVIRMIIRFTNN